jgi:hypothetical protein
MKFLKLSIACLTIFYSFHCTGAPDEFFFNYEDVAKRILHSLYATPSTRKSITESTELNSDRIFIPQDSLISQDIVFNGLTPTKLTGKLQQLRTTLDPKQIPKAEISYLFADAKFDGKNLKILELGEGKNGGFRSFDAIFETGGIWKEFWHYIFSLGLPVFYIGSIKPNKADNEIIAFESFKKHKGLAVKSLPELKNTLAFQKLLQKKRHTLNRSSLASYKGIIVYKYFDNCAPSRLID